MRIVRILSLVTVCAVLGVGGAQIAAADAPANFAGTWKFNAARGENLGMMASIQQTQTIQQTKAELSIAESSDFQGQKSSRTLRYDLTGAPVNNEGPMGGQAVTVAKWEGAALVVTWTTSGSVAGSVNVRTETRTLSADGRTMTIRSQRGAQAKPMTQVFEKQ